VTERERIEALWRKYLDMADANDDEGSHIGFSRYYRNVAAGLGLALNVLDGSRVPVDLYERDAAVEPPEEQP